ncbi:hypothetical protein IGI04_019975 [Brassica rapa subsp. trilocularis]|uniref:Uncharacterized protein n=1 Tax=Brassica rapa subsp. trilocularis TaxID=1813537 RepID=A0ABQ7MHE5_BRACM|nr:hypothetical protein IGI04_019975 [Brassica rapa subsp. trilocularis]
MRAKQLVVGPPWKKRRLHRSEFVAVVTGLELGGSMGGGEWRREEFEVVMKFCQSKALATSQCSSSCPVTWQRNLAVVVEVKPSKKKKRGGERETTKTHKEEEDTARWMGEDNTCG